MPTEDTVVKPAGKQTTEELVQGLFSDEPPVEASLEATETHFHRNATRSTELRCGHNFSAADVILHELLVRKMRGTLREGEETGSGFYFALSVLAKVAELRHGKMVAGILYWDEIYEIEDRSERIILVRLLGKIGTPEHAVPALHHFAQRVQEEVTYTPMPPGYDVEFWDDGEDEPRPVFVKGTPPEELKADDQRVVKEAISRMRERHPSTK